MNVIFDDLIPSVSIKNKKGEHMNDNAFLHKRSNDGKLNWW